MSVAGGLIVMLILVFGTIWIGQNARRDTEAAARSVSLLYLDELAGRSEQVVAENLQDRVSDMRTALELMTADDLMDAAHRQAYQVKMKALFGLEKFAFVGESGTMYTANGSKATTHLRYKRSQLGSLEGNGNVSIGKAPAALADESHHPLQQYLAVNPCELFRSIGEKVPDVP